MVPSGEQMNTSRNKPERKNMGNQREWKSKKDSFDSQRCKFTMKAMVTNGNGGYEHFGLTLCKGNPLCVNLQIREILSTDLDAVFS